MSSKNEVDLLLNLIKTKKLSLNPYSFKSMEAPIKEALKLWLKSKDFPTDNPIDLVGSEYVLAWFDDNVKLIIFGLSYDGPEQCGGTIVFSFDGKNCTYLTDTVECSS